MPEDRGPASLPVKRSGTPEPRAPAGRKAIVTEYARECGFDLVRVTSAREFTEDRDAALDRLQAGLMDGLPWFNESRVRRGSSPEALLPGARSVICLGLNYFQHGGDASAEFPAEFPAGRVARYAWGEDYHRVVKKRMASYVAGLRLRLESDFGARWYIDDGPMLDRAAAGRSGLGWFGKNTNILTPELGSWVFLGQVITDLDLEEDQPLKKTCGSCVRCIDACPTGAIVAPYVLDNTRCISHLTIENRGEIPLDLRPLMGDWIFGCDICQDVCPVNRKDPSSKPTLWQRAPAGDPGPSAGRADVPRGSKGLAHAPAGGGKPPEGHPMEKAAASLPHKMATLDLVSLLDMSEESFRSRFKGSPILRAKRVGLQRNACVALGNHRDERALPALGRALRHEEPLVRGHAAWALGRIGGSEARQALRLAAADESDPGVLREIGDALGEVLEEAARD